MTTEQLEAQESELETETAIEAVADQTSSPEVTEGVSSSDTTEEDTRSPAEMARDEFLEKYGKAEDEGEGDEKPDEKPADAQAEAPKTEDAPEKSEAVQKDDSEDELRITDDEFKKLPENVRQRIGHLNARAKKAERQLEENATQVETFKDSHERFSQLTTFVEQNNIQPENVTKAFDMMAQLSKGDYDGFLAQVMPWVDLAQQATGKAYAPDLQERIDNGYLTEEAAREITQSRRKAEQAEGRAQQHETKLQAKTAEETQVENLDKIVSAVNAREAELRSSDPDYAQKSARVKAAMEFAMKRGGVPKTPAEGVEMVNDAYALIGQSKPAAPKLPTPPRPSSSTSTRGQAIPKSLNDVISQAAESYVPSRN